MKTLPMPPRELFPVGHSDRVPNGAGILLAFAASLLFWAVVAALFL